MHTMYKIPNFIAAWSDKLYNIAEKSTWTSSQSSYNWFKLSVCICKSIACLYRNWKRDIEIHPEPDFKLECWSGALTNWATGALALKDRTDGIHIRIDIVWFSAGIQWLHTDFNVLVSVYIVHLLALRYAYISVYMQPGELWIRVITYKLKEHQMVGKQPKTGCSGMQSQITTVNHLLSINIIAVRRYCQVSGRSSKLSFRMRRCAEASGLRIGFPPCSRLL